MLSKLLAFFRRSPIRNIEVTSAQTIAVGPSDFLVITVESGIDVAVLRQFQERAQKFFKSQNILVVAGDDVRVLKIAIEDRMADEIMLKEEITKWEELVALIFTFCISPQALPNQNDTETLVRCNTYVTDCVVDIKSHWTKKDLERCEQEGLSRNWKHEQ